MAQSIEILTIGDELLRGELVDTNSAWLAERLHLLGLRVGRSSTIGDGEGEIAAFIAAAAGRCRALIVSGGLGPTDDDRTASAVAAALGVELVLDEVELSRLKERFAAVGLKYTENNEKQAWLPQGAEVLQNDRGTAPGFAVKLGECRIACMPGVPSELERMFDRQVAPLLEREIGGKPAELRRVKVFGLGEAQVGDKLSDLLEVVDLEATAASIHYRATFPEIHVSAVVRHADSAIAARVADRLLETICSRLGRHVFSTNEDGLAEVLVSALRQKKAKVAFAESCTGGLAGDLITNASGSSEVFWLSTVVYHNDIKHRVIGVPREILETDGAVSQACVEAMAKGVRELAGSTYAVAISGIAGPGGGSEEKPVGTVHFALASPTGVRHLHRVFRHYGRLRIKRLSAFIAHWLVYSELRGDDSAGDDPLAGRWKPKK